MKIFYFLKKSDNFHFFKNEFLLQRSEISLQKKIRFYSKKNENVTFFQENIFIFFLSDCIFTLLEWDFTARKFRLYIIILIIDIIVRSVPI